MIIFVDFDDTLCLHRRSIRSEQYILGTPEYIAHFAYKESMKNKSLEQWLLNKQNSAGEETKIIMLSKASSIMFEAKKIWMSKNMPDVKLYESYSLSEDIGSKVVIVEAYVKQNSGEHIFFIDDDASERRKVEERCPNVTVVSPQFLQNANQINYHKKECVIMDKTNIADTTGNVFQNTDMSAVGFEPTVNQLYFELKDNYHTFQMGLSTILECLLYAEQKGEVPDLPPEWKNTVSDIYGIHVEDDTEEDIDYEDIQG